MSLHVRCCHRVNKLNYSLGTFCQLMLSSDFSLVYSMFTRPLMSIVVDNSPERGKETRRGSHKCDALVTIFIASICEDRWPFLSLAV